MKAKMLILSMLLLGFMHAHAQLSEIYENRKWDIFFNYTQFQYDQGDAKVKYNFLKPFYVRIGTDKVGSAKPHFSWQIPLGSDALWSSLMGTDDESGLNNQSQLNQYGISSGILGVFQLKFNIVGKDDFVIAVGVEFGDNATSENWSVIVGPALLIEKAMTNLIALGINMSTSKVVATNSEQGDAKDMWVTSIYPRVLFKKGWYLEAGLMFTNEVNGIKYSRTDFNLGKSFRF
ncbi:MAG: hypothetical protein R8N23_03715 [Reichenbachiella sp.]|uniref:hypothetical protein n=1 Tax=Reichenbachiella sp. TaxID=2184521 RepID=UPI002966FCCD|nr:hypothetical protein [Reichenbachiella sp.]MDW3208945.1 hypothetical protein [Reichenbachiella sp.]